MLSISIVGQNVPLTYESIIQQEWLATYSGQDSIINSATAIDINKNVIVTGYTYDAVSKSNITTIKYDVDGTQLWAVDYDYGINKDERATGITSDQNGDIYVIGYSWNGANNDLVVIKYKPTGQQQWVYRYDNGSKDDGVAIKIDGNGDVCVAGNSYGTGLSDYVTLKLNSSYGNLIWVKRYDGGSYDFISGLEVNSVNDLFVTGNSRISGQNDIVTIKYKSNGSTAWTKTYGSSNDNDNARDITIDNGGNIYITGSSQTDMITLCYNWNGVQKWVATYNGFQLYDVGNSIVTDNANGVYITGTSMTPAYNTILTTIKYKSNTGNQEWVQHYYSEPHSKNSAIKIIADQNNDVFITARGFNGTNMDFFTIKYLNDGTEKWAEKFNGSGNGDDVPSDLATDFEGNVYVTGQTKSGSLYEFATVKYGVSEVLIPPDMSYEKPSANYIFYGNKGQLLGTDGQPRPDILFYNNASSPGIFVRDNGLSYVFAKIDTAADTPDTLVRVDMTFPKAKPTVPLVTEQVPGVLNYYLAHIPEGRTNISGYQRVIYPDIFELIDLQYYSNSKGLKFYFVVNEGGDASNIRMKFEGAESVNVTANGGLIIHTAIGDKVFEKAHVARFNAAGNIVPLPSSGSFELAADGTVGIDVQNYPPNQKLVIVVDEGHKSLQEADNLLWSTYFGGNQKDYAYSLTMDNDGNQIITGHTNSDYFPVVNNEYEYMASEGLAFLTKFTPNHQRKFSTYYGGFGDLTYGDDVACNSQNEIYVSGHTNSANLKTRYLTGAYNDSILGGTTFKFDCFIAKFTASCQLTWSTYFGGTKSETAFNIVVDSNDDIYIAGYSQGDDFPMKYLTGAYNDTIFSGSVGLSSDIFISKFNSANQLLWSTYYGGTGSDFGLSICLDQQNNLFMTGMTNSSDFETYDASGNSDVYGYAESYDAFIIKFNTSGAREWATYIGGSGYDGSYNLPQHLITTDKSNNLFVIGQTASEDFPVQEHHSGQYGYQPDYGGGSKDGFIMQFDNSNKLKWSSYMGGNDYDVCLGVTTDELGTIFVTGATGSNDFFIEEFGGVYNQDTLGGSSYFYGDDAFLTCFASWNKDIIWATYLGGTSSADDQGRDLIVSEDNMLYVTGFTSSQNQAGEKLFPLKDPGYNAYFQDSYGGGNYDAFISKLDVTLINSVKEINSVLDHNAILFPNPTTGLSTLLFETDSRIDISIIITDINGRQIIEKKVENISENIKVNVDLSKYSNGVYVINVLSDNFLIKRKLIKIQ